MLGAWGEAPQLLCPVAWGQRETCAWSLPAARLCQRRIDCTGQPCGVTALLRRQIETEEWHAEVTLGRNSEENIFKALFTQTGLWGIELARLQAFSGRLRNLTPSFHWDFSLLFHNVFRVEQFLAYHCNALRLLLFLAKHDKDISLCEEKLMILLNYWILKRSCSHSFTFFISLGCFLSLFLFCSKCLWRAEHCLHVLFLWCLSSPYFKVSVAWQSRDLANLQGQNLNLAEIRRNRIWMR